MPWDANEEDAFPARRSNEPGGLRQDILDEIADHLACAAERERERDETGNEDTIWHRVLERFGDPDAVARRLWWDQMKETVMREWIQTGVLIVLAAAVIAGVALLITMMGRQRQSEEAMRTAMEQMAASNQALQQALSNISQGMGVATSPGLELSTIEIVVRRGTPEGPPAPEVEVTFEGRGQNDDDLSLSPELDSEGRTVFERLYQGTYTFTFYDPQSKLSSRQEVTLFAGQGAGEHVFVAPDVTPRPIEIDWDLPAFGRDSDVLIGTRLMATWQHDDMEWGSWTVVTMGHQGVVVAGDSHRPLHTGPRIRRGENVWGPGEEKPACALAGHIELTGGISVLFKEPAGNWRATRSLVFENATTRPDVDVVSLIKLQVLSDGHFQAALPEELRSHYEWMARGGRNFENVTDEAFASWLWHAAESLTEETVVAATWPAWPTPTAIEKDGRFFQGTSKTSYYIGSFNGMSHVLLVGLDGGDHAIDDEGIRSQIGLRVVDATQNVVIEGSDGTMTLSDKAGVSDNFLAAYFVRSPLPEEDLPPYDKEKPVQGVALEVDPEPFWQLPAIDLLEEYDDNKKTTKDHLFIPMPNDVLSGGERRPHSVMVKWKEATEEDTWFLAVSRSNDHRDRICQLTTIPLEGAGGDTPLKDVDGKFHYDGLKGRPVLAPAE